LQFDLNSTAAPLRLFFNGTLFLEMPQRLARKCRDPLVILPRSASSTFIWIKDSTDP